jgi:formiminoglutamate deiminase
VSSTAFHCELAWLGGDAAAADVLVEVADGIITDIRAGVRAPAGAVVLHGLTLPGFANAHSHAFHRALRGRTHAGTGSFWTWRDQMYGLAERLTPTSYRALARAVYGEMVLSGMTVVGEFHYLHHDTDGVPYEEPNAMGEALIGAAGEAGLRITLLDTCYLHGGVGADGSPVAPSEVQRRFSDGSAAAWAERVDALADAYRNDPMVRVGAAIHSVRAVDPFAMRVVARWATERGAPLHAHVSEQPAENEQCMAAHGITPTALLDVAGALTPRFTSVHGTHLTPHDIERYQAHGCTVCFCPTTERDLADGIGPSSALRDAGVALALGSDSHAVIDLFEEMRALELNERLATLRRGNHEVQALLHAATAEGYRSLGWDGAGVLAAGVVADFVTVGLGSVRLAGTDAVHALASVVYAAAPADVHHVVVGGEVVVREGAHVRFDVAAELARVLEAL